MIRLFDGPEALAKIADQTVEMTHLTKTVPAIKRLIYIYDILDMNMQIQKQFTDGEIWDFAALRAMNITRAELMVYHHIDFDPYKELYKYNNRLCGLLRLLAHKYEKDELIPITEL